MKSNSKTQPPSLGSLAFTGKSLNLPKPAKAAGSESGTGSRKKSTKND